VLKLSHMKSFQKEWSGVTVAKHFRSLHLSDKIFFTWICYNRVRPSISWTLFCWFHIVSMSVELRFYKWRRLFLYWLNTLFNFYFLFFYLYCWLLFLNRSSFELKSGFLIFLIGVTTFLWRAFIFFVMPAWSWQKAFHASLAIQCHFILQRDRITFYLREFFS